MCFFKFFREIPNNRYKYFDKKINIKNEYESKFIKMGNAKNIFLKNEVKIEKLFSENIIDKNVFKVLNYENKALYLSSSHNGFLILKDGEKYFIPITTFKDIKQYKSYFYELCGLDSSTVIKTIPVTEKHYLVYCLRNVTDLIKENKYEVVDLELKSIIVDNQLGGMENLLKLKNE